MAEPATLYKLIILHMLEHIDFPLSNAQISDFFLDREYTDYFTIQQVIHDLMDSRACPYGKHPQQYTVYHYSCRKRNAAFFS